MGVPVPPLGSRSHPGENWCAAGSLAGSAVWADQFSIPALTIFEAWVRRRVLRQSRASDAPLLGIASFEDVFKGFEERLEEIFSPGCCKLFQNSGLSLSLTVHPARTTKFGTHIST